MNIPELTMREKSDTAAYWGNHADELARLGLSDRVVASVACYANPNSIGYDQGQVRPGDLGKWDVYYSLKDYLTPGEALLASGLSESEVAAEDERNRLRDTYGIDPDNPDQVAEIRELERLSPDEIASRIEERTALLA
jgi:hypothetical protein